MGVFLIAVGAHVGGVISRFPLALQSVWGGWGGSYLLPSKAFGAVGGVVKVCICVALNVLPCAVVVHKRGRLGGCFPRFRLPSKAVGAAGGVVSPCPPKTVRRPVRRRAVGLPSPRAASAGGGGWVRGGSVRGCPPCGLSRSKGGGWRQEPRQSVFRSFGCLVSPSGGTFAACPAPRS